MRQLNPIEHADMIRLTVAIVGYGSHGTLKILLGEMLKTKCNKNINHIAPLLLTCRPSNPKYHMAQEEVEHHNLMVNIRNLARTAITDSPRVPPTKTKRPTSTKTSVWTSRTVRPDKSTVSSNST
jgi:hypothetical protein